MTNKIKKYKQTEIPQVTITDKKDLVKVIKEYHLQSRSKHKKINLAYQDSLNYSNQPQGLYFYAAKIKIKFIMDK